MKTTADAKRGKGLVNSVIDRLPIEIHLPGYRFCGPGTKLAKRLKRGDKGVNPLDEACREHDIEYSRHKDDSARRVADKKLADRAWERVKASDSSWGEKASAMLVTGAMKVKSKLGKGIVSRRKKTQSGGGGKQNDKRKKMQRLPTAKRGGFLPLIPLFAGLSALGSLVGGATGIVKTLNTAKEADRRLQELNRHNRVMEENFKGKGLSGGGGRGRKRRRVDESREKKKLGGRGMYIGPPPSTSGWGGKKNSR